MDYGRDITVVDVRYRRPDPLPGEERGRVPRGIVRPPEPRESPGENSRGVVSP